ncbi:uncharacterized protein SCHCODRAFT_02702058 [Schizophyllum commune H4-8]|uniref:Uncharacterized protein n=1 Tax=Schizophyllum commune (strain H4-8 / FGSC 9210) TaxID=578458 RepID=D8Q828_SCHCM|nr:uncharacterized protein SCHCODRAFT_02702058 [Schizophyllum commune H4-8]KAI5891238.1 hypothetical protein SCHCODRAFT_02702058 [Schizophyllum commune H4-8]
MSSRSHMRRQRVLDLERQQELEDCAAMRMTEDQRRTLSGSFASVKCDFTDLDGQQWTGAALRSRSHHCPTPPSLHTPQYSEPYVAFAVLTNADLASFGPEETVRASASKHFAVDAEATITCHPDRPLPEAPTEPPNNHRNGVRSRSPVKGLFPAPEPERSSGPLSALGRGRRPTPMGADIPRSPVSEENEPPLYETSVRSPNLSTPLPSPRAVDFPVPPTDGFPAPTEPPTPSFVLKRNFQFPPPIVTPKRAKPSDTSSLVGMSSPCETPVRPVRLDLASALDSPCATPTPAGCSPLLPQTPSTVLETPTSASRSKLASLPSHSKLPETPTKYRSPRERAAMAIMLAPGWKHESVRREEDSQHRRELHGSPRRREEDPLLAMFHTWSPHKQQDFLRVHGQKYPQLALDYRQTAKSTTRTSLGDPRATLNDTDMMSPESDTMSTASSAVTGLGIA